MAKNVSVHPSPDFPACCVESAHLPKRKLRAFAFHDEKKQGRVNGYQKQGGYTAIKHKQVI